MRIFILILVCWFAGTWFEFMERLEFGWYKIVVGLLLVAFGYFIKKLGV